MSKKSYIDFGDNFNFGELVFLASLIVGELVCRRVGCRRVGLSASFIIIIIIIIINAQIKVTLSQ